MRDLASAPSDNRRLGRAVAAGLLGLLIICFATGTEWWPLSAFALFSQVRGPEQTSWGLTVVQTDGGVDEIDLGRLPESHWGTHHVLPTLADASSGEQKAAIQAWLTAVGYDLETVDEVQVVREVTLVPTERGATPVPVSESVTLTVSLP